MDEGRAFRFVPAQPSDLERLVVLRVEAMRESLMRIGRFDEVRARQRMVDGFRPDHTRLIFAGGALAGCVAFAPRAAGVRWLEHFYIFPNRQGRGLGAAVLGALLAEADAAGEAVEMTVVRESPAHRFYARFGFVETGRDEVDVFYRRDATARSRPA
jgi:GNAT superfamily N-acetyltransferase